MIQSLKAFLTFIKIIIKEIKNCIKELIQKNLTHPEIAAFHNIDKAYKTSDKYVR